MACTCDGGAIRTCASHIESPLRLALGSKNSAD